MRINKSILTFVFSFLAIFLFSLGMNIVNTASISAESFAGLNEVELELLDDLSLIHI